MNTQELRTNKQELISKYELIKNSFNFKVVATDGIISDLKRLDEPEKVKVPQFVADWYEEHKDNLEFNIFDYAYRFDQNPGFDFKDWFDDFNTKPIQTLVNMHQFGYEVEKEKRYRISMQKARNHKNHAQILCENDSKMFWCAEWYSHRTKFTRKELEDAGFGWVFDCPGIEIEEVKDE